ncbi:hypothetical protein EUC41_26685 [Achromobacter denitrificans]|uniref:hypothetical protein n=1 Tax=Achromobacter denitrificans TaxID=32002 RepID=UPI00240E884C|nr:hypothetical protein [Achromobacter denitrificans]WFC69584.1 hypothetical protein EUC41_26685 [Achromobacter denitrificans]
MKRRQFFAATAAPGITGLAAAAGLSSTAGDAASLHAQVEQTLSRKTLSVRDIQLRYGGRTLLLEPGIYEYSQTLELNGDLRLAANGPPGSVILRYTGSDIALVINSTSTSLNDAPEHVRSLSIENVSIAAERARQGILIGARTQPGITLRGVGIYGVQGAPVYCGDAVYFLAMHHCTVRDCAAPVYVGAYCDLFTVDDRSLFTGNPGGALLLQCPTFLITNSDFESNGGLADIVIRNAPDMAAIRNGLLMKNRHGPEVAEGAAAVRHDIALVEAPGLPAGTAMTDLRIWANDHFSGGRFARKTSPVLLDARVRRLDIRASMPVGYAAADYITTSDAAVVYGAGTVWDNRIDDLPVQDALRGLFRPEGKDMRRAVAAQTLPAGVMVQAIGYRSADAGNAVAVTVLGANDSAAGYDAVYGWLSYDAPADRPIALHAPGAVVSTQLDGRAAQPMAPVYLQRDGTPGLTPPAGATPLRIGRLLTADAQARILLEA